MKVVRAILRDNSHRATSSDLLTLQDYVSRFHTEFFLGGIACMTFDLKVKGHIDSGQGSFSALGIIKL